MSLVNWNKSTFGNIYMKKRRILAHIAGIQKCIANHHNNRLLNLDTKPRKYPNDILAQEEILWYQKSKEDWIRSDDRNTKYYHALTVVRRSMNRIGALKSESGEWLTNMDTLAHHVQKFYKQFFNKDIDCNESLALKGWFSSIPTQMLNNIHVPFSDVEIKQALFDMSPFKAPRPYGFHAGFFQRMWDIVGDSIIKFARNLFDKGCLPERVNDTLLVLVPNVEYP